jgi:hypothetical protein
MDWNSRILYGPTQQVVLEWGATKRLYNGAGAQLADYSSSAGVRFTPKLMVSNGVSVSPAYHYHAHETGATAVALGLTNSATGSTSSDGFNFGITTAGVGEIRQRENQNVTIYTNNTLRNTLYAAGAWNFVAVAAPGSPANGDLWSDSTQKALQVFQDGIKQNLEGVIFTQTATGTIANSTTETAITSTGIGTLTLPTNFFIAGKTLLIKGSGFHSSTASPTCDIKVKFGSTTIVTTGAHTHHNATNGYFEFSAIITCRTTGASGTVFGQGSFFDATELVPMGTIATVTINTTTTQAITVSAQWSAASASNTISMTNFSVEVLN